MNIINEESLTAIGRVVKTVGYKGKIVIEPYHQSESTWEAIDKCIIKVQGIWAPFFIENKRLMHDELEIKLTEYSDDTRAKEIVQQEVYVLDSQIVETEDIQTEDELTEWIGFEVHDLEYGLIGTIDDIEELPGQILIYLHYNGKRISIPFVDELVEDMTIENKKIFMNLPAGLLELE